MMNHLYVKSIVGVGENVKAYVYEIVDEGHMGWGVRYIGKSNNNRSRDTLFYDINNDEVDYHVDIPKNTICMNYAVCKLVPRAILNSQRFSTYSVTAAGFRPMFNNMANHDLIPHYSRVWHHPPVYYRNVLAANARTHFDQYTLEDSTRIFPVGMLVNHNILRRQCNVTVYNIADRVIMTERVIGNGVNIPLWILYMISTRIIHPGDMLYYNYGYNPSDPDPDPPVPDVSHDVIDVDLMYDDTVVDVLSESPIDIGNREVDSIHRVRVRDRSPERIDLRAPVDEVIELDVPVVVRRSYAVDGPGPAPVADSRLVRFAQEIDLIPVNDERGRGEALVRHILDSDEVVDADVVLDPVVVNDQDVEDEDEDRVDNDYDNFMADITNYSLSDVNAPYHREVDVLFDSEMYKAVAKYDRENPIMSDAERRRRIDEVIEERNRRYKNIEG